MRRWAACVLLMATASSALADGDESKRTGYRQDLIISDALSIAAFLGGGIYATTKEDSGANTLKPGSMALTIGLGGFLLASPIVHASRGNGRRAWASFGLRIGAAYTATIAFGGGYGHIGDNERELLAAVGVAAIGASVIDIVFFVPDAPRDSPSRAIAPTMVPVAGGALGGVAGYW